MKFYKNEKLTIGQLSQRFGICRKTFSNRKIDLLYDLSHFCKYEIIREGRSEIYHFLEDGEYIYCRKNSKEMKERDAIYEKAIIQILTDQPLNTAANISRIAKETIPEITQLGYADATNYEYIRVRMRKWFGKDEHDLPLFGEELQRKGYIDHKTWCYLDVATNIYVPLTEEQIADLKNIFQKYFGKEEEKSLILASALDAGLLTKEEYQKKIGDLNFDNFLSTKQAFKDKYKVMPIKVPYYIIVKHWRESPLSGSLQ